MRKPVISLVISLIFLLSGVTACGSSNDSTESKKTAGQTVSSTITETGSPSVDTCASAGTRKIPKTRLLADLALTYGAFHRYLYKPYKADAFHKGAEGRGKAITKAVLASAVIVKLLSNAKKNAAADPTLCKYLPTIDGIKASLASLTSKIKNGTVAPGDADGTNGLFEELRKGAGFAAPSSSALPGLG
ncbi:hypothetical protein GCM10010129_00570 [Streptomyces fumigatiscleroticus]|nr:hypothetical protein GCM10010129_00570 [Streptomyces fumigatiscleroticus]